MNSAVRRGLITGVLLLFLILVGIFSTFEALTLRGLWLTIAGATASEISAQAASATNPPFSRVFTAAIALLGGALAMQRAGNFRRGLIDAVVVNAVAGAVVGVFLVVVSVLYGALFDVSFVVEKLKPDVVKALLYDQPALPGAAIWVLGMAIAGAVGALLWGVWRAVSAARTVRPGAPSRVSSNQLRLGALVALGLALLIAPQFIGVYWNQVLGSIGLFVLLGLGLNIVVGFAGLLDLGYVGFFALGAYTVAVLTAPAFPVQWGFWLALPIAMVVAALAGTLLGIPVLRLRGDYLAIVTLGFGEIIRIIFKFNPLTGGPQGVLNVAPPNFTLPLVNVAVTFGSSTAFWYLIFIACVVVAFVAARLNESRVGRAWTAMREDEDAAEAMGIDTTRSKLLAFGVGAFFAGLGGAIYASRQQHIFPDDFTLLVSINALALIIIGGLGSIPGVIIGSIVLIGLPEVLRPIADYRLLVYAALLVVMMLVRPEGLVPSARRRREVHERDPELETVESA